MVPRTIVTLSMTLAYYHFHQRSKVKQEKKGSASGQRKKKKKTLRESATCWKGEKKKKNARKREITEKLTPELLDEKKKVEAQRIQRLREVELNQTHDGIVSPTKTKKNVTTRNLHGDASMMLPTVSSSNEQQSISHTRSFEDELLLLSASTHPKKENLSTYR